MLDINRSNIQVVFIFDRSKFIGRYEVKYDHVIINKK